MLQLKIPHLQWRPCMLQLRPGAAKKKKKVHSLWDEFCLVCLAFEKIETLFSSWKILFNIRISSLCGEVPSGAPGLSPCGQPRLGCLDNVLCGELWATDWPPLLCHPAHVFSCLPLPSPEWSDGVFVKVAEGQVVKSSLHAVRVGPLPQPAPPSSVLHSEVLCKYFTWD